ncbi:MAG: hypothetical protein QN122_05105 [Armatimonadota bacterium]|nr:hypothetical protein [Armatimonadota bacterium]MDR7490813.1 hypothetical protein [Armatimonadota bacterium]MDR7575749.1 hypothetical protein [Armatimonadota bacterium]MDR7591393.1 hypothetical protein [Armatimonadota bacterium]
MGFVLPLGFDPRRVVAASYPNGANICAGRHDPLVPIELAERLADLLRHAGAHLTLLWNEVGHGLTAAEIAAARAWPAEAVPS